MYYDYECEACIEKHHQNDRIGSITEELRKQLNTGSHRYLKYGTSFSVVVTRHGLFFEDIA